jgi:nucleoid DNA-binding protein
LRPALTESLAKEPTNMTKTQLIQELEKSGEMPPRDAEVAVEAVFDSILQWLRMCPETPVTIRGFGSFSIRPHPLRPRRGQSQSDLMLTHFKPSPALKDRVNRPQVDPAQETPRGLES